MALKFASDRPSQSSDKEATSKALRSQVYFLIYLENERRKLARRISKLVRGGWRV